MILPRAWVPKKSGLDYGHLAINRAIAASRPSLTHYVLGLFYKQRPGARRNNAYKGMATKMAKKFAAKVMERT